MSIDQITTKTKTTKEATPMREGLNEPVSVLSIYSKKHNIFKPEILTWDNIDYRLGKIDFYHKTKKGTTTLHHFSLTDKEETTYFKLVFNATNLNWTLEEYMNAGEAQAHYFSSDADSS